ncbi:MAG: Membrane-bound lysozyme-inhibitor of c-type lysozyme [Candidatus Accumulibacter sp. BA-94]|uniref:lysozyme inhibitor LprI family protein n=1 Tax=Accumulibacter sp. TaxID=2053492 RepID=UPI00044E979F|nr:lysozyme inhibitor LprI family protein [Accumulibacter sp.]EXI90183.1 MAG: Membrane-bound lysozyme-inhibitor of c-type lysozyme [Candidatus Accumulibacter sp. BA-94]HRD91216.1 MliC family protein [Accumulibacter sp.]
MKKPVLVVSSFIAGAVVFPLTVLAQGPTFNCAKASGEVETLICADASLAALDRKLAEVYKAASAKARGNLATRLREDQRGWVKGRNDCWKAKVKTWITATWTVDTVKECIDAQYRVRTSELQAVWQLLPPKTVAHACQNNAANEVVANFFATDPATIRLERGDRTVTMWLVGSASDGKYEGQNVSLVHQGNELKVSWLDTTTGKTDELQCKAK